MSIENWLHFIAVYGLRRTLLGNAIFSNAPLSFKVWLLLVPFALALLLAEEGRKCLARRKGR